MKSGLFKLNGQDFVKGLASAVISAVVFAVVGVVYSLVQQTGFDVFTADWGAVLNTSVAAAVNAGVAALVGYLGKNFLSDSEGKVLGKI